MQTARSPEKPKSEVLRPELTRLPELTPWRRFARRALVGLARLLVWLLLRAEVRGLENLPAQGPALIVSNHLGDADVPAGLGLSREPAEMLAKIELHDFPVLGWLMDAYGVIWVHRGQPDRRAVRAVLSGLKEGRMVALAPEGRESVTGALEEGTQGAAYLALKSGAPVIPVTFTGTENSSVFAHWKRLRRAPITLTVGPAFELDPGEDWRQAVDRGTQTIMLTLARQLPPEYRGAYRQYFEGQELSGGAG